MVKSDCDTFNDIMAGLKDNHSGEAQAVAEELRTAVHRDIFSARFCEADTFSLFESLMEAVGPWFISNQSVHNVGSGYEGKPWSRPQDQTTGNKLVDNLNYIQDVLLRRHDPALFSRLEKLEIFPQIYGIRWLRLLFGREFVFRDTLLLWDAIFADSCPPRLCDQLVVSLLMAIRDLLLRYEYQDAVQLLMKLPSNLSVTYCTQFALHLKDPIRFPKPSGSAFAHGVVGTGKEKKKLVKTENKFRKISAPKLFSKNPTEAVKTPFELVRPLNRFTTEPDGGSDFTVLEVKKDDLERGDVNDIDSASAEHPGKEPKLRDKPPSSHGRSMNVREKLVRSDLNNRDITVIEVKTDLESAVKSLDSLLGQETLLRRTEILQSVERIKCLVSKLPSSHTQTSVKAHRTASVAVDVAKYFEED